jgi:hypothetical protein
MSSKEKVLAIRPGCLLKVHTIRVDNKTHLYYVVNFGAIPIGESGISKSEAWAAAYKYLTK